MYSTYLARACSGKIIFVMELIGLKRKTRSVDLPGNASTHTVLTAGTTRLSEVSDQGPTKLIEPIRTYPIAAPLRIARTNSGRSTYLTWERHFLAWTDLPTMPCHGLLHFGLNLLVPASFPLGMFRTVKYIRTCSWMILKLASRSYYLTFMFSART